MKKSAGPVGLIFNNGCNAVSGMVSDKPPFHFWEWHSGVLVNYPGKLYDWGLKLRDVVLVAI